MTERVVIGMFLLAAALGCYESFFWGSFLRFGSDGAGLRRPGDGLRLILGPGTLLTGVVTRIVTARRLVERAMWALLGVWTLAWIASGVLLIHEAVAWEPWVLGNPRPIWAAMLIFGLSPMLVVLGDIYTRIEE